MIQVIEQPPESLHELLGVAATAVAGPNLDDALRALDEAGFELPADALDVYMDHMRQIAEYEIANVPTDSPTAAVRYVVLGTVLIEPLILALGDWPRRKPRLGALADARPPWETGPRGDLRGLYRRSAQG